MLPPSPQDVLREPPLTSSHRCVASLLFSASAGGQVPLPLATPHQPILSCSPAVLLRESVVPSPRPLSVAASLSGQSQLLIRGSSLPGGEQLLAAESQTAAHCCHC